MLVENVGNLVCPALFDLRAHPGRGLSDTEGEDKPATYPTMFRTADFVLLNKIDLLPYVDFAGARHLTFDEAVPQEFDVEVGLPALDSPDRTVEIVVPGGEEIETLGTAGRVVRTRWPLAATVRVGTTDADAPFPLRRLRVVTENAVPTCPPTRRGARQCAGAWWPHTLLAVRGGAFLSLLDPWRGRRGREGVHEPARVSGAGR